MKRLGALLVLLVVACGKRGDPHPPVPLIPQTTTDLVVTQRAGKVLLTWSYPSLTTAGQSLKNIRRVVVYRATEASPVPIVGGDAKNSQPMTPGSSAAESVHTFSLMQQLGPLQFAKLRDRIDSIEGSELPAATAGARLTYEDSPAFRTSDGRAVRLTYAVVTETENAKGDISNLVSIVPFPAPTAPTALTATVKPEGVVLSWTPASGPAELLAGYNIYRRPATQPAGGIATPANPTPVSGSTWTDVPSYGDYIYEVRAVASVGPPLIESDPTAAVTATFKDLLPPPAPAHVTALVETKAVRLVWDAAASPDFAGYFVYRFEGKTKLKLTPGVDTVANFVDISVDPGIEYRYGVTSVDKNGNESAPTMSDPVLVPKTP